MPEPFVYFDRNGVRRILIPGDERTFRVLTQQDVEPILESVNRDREIMAHNGDNKVLARLPVEIYERMIQEGWGPDDEAKWLNSSEAAAYRIWRGRV
jgi:hypothetical protein